MMNNFKFLLITIFLFKPAFCGLKIEINRGTFQPDPIAIVSFVNNSGLDNLGANISKVIEENLESSGLFIPIDKSSFIQTRDSLLKDGVRFADWRLIKTRFLLYGELEDLGFGKIEVKFHLFDVNTGESMQALAMSGDKEKWRKIAHMISDSIYTRVTNETGYFNTQIVFVEALSGKGKNQKKRLVRMDRDGFNFEPLTDGKNLVLTPRYSKDGKNIAYLSFINKEANIYVMDLKTKRQTLLGNFRDMNFAPRFSPDSKKVVMSIVENGASAIYTMDLLSKKLTRLTDHISIDTSPCFSPDGSEIVFTSNRSGKEHIYIMDINGGSVRRISFGDDGKYSQPVWSPRGDIIAFTKQVGNTFYIGIINVDGSQERLIAQGFLVEGADWSPNGRYIMFSKENSLLDKGKIYVVDLTGRNMREVKTTADCSDCSWSPLLTGLD
jgi:TolB protein